MIASKKLKTEQSIHIQINERCPTGISFNMETYIKKIISLCEIKTGSFEFTFCDNAMIIDMNKKHLKRDYATDIISFNLGSGDAPIGDIYISVQQAKENVQDLDHSYDDEIKVLIIHGILHLLGYEDYTAEQKKDMFKEQDRIFQLAAHDT